MTSYAGASSYLYTEGFTGIFGFSQPKRDCYRRELTSPILRNLSENFNIWVTFRSQTKAEHVISHSLGLCFLGGQQR
jgi:hypothetical protein